jgi:hypothetical protein
MTLKYMQGFESMRDDTDFRAQNWIQAPTKQQGGFPPSISSVSGTSLKLIGAGSASSAAAGASGVPDIGYFNTGITVNQAWLAGGFSFGFAAQFNSGVQSSYGAGTLATSTGQPNTSCFDGTRYWAIQLTGSTYSLAYSTNLNTWTNAAAQPPLTMDALTSVWYVGNNTVCVIRITTTGMFVNYTTNSASTWSTQTIFTATGATLAGSSGGIVATGNANYPHAILMTANTSSTGTNLGGVFVGTLGGTFTQVITLNAANMQSYARYSVTNGLVMLPMSGGTGPQTIYSATASNAALNTTGAWSTATLSSSLYVTDIAYNPVSNLWVISGGSGIWTFANAGAPGTAVAPSGAVTITQRYSTATMQRVTWNGSQLVAFGGSGHIITSPDGITWTESGGHLLPVGVAGTDWRCAIYDGSRYVLFSDATNGVIATTPDGVTNYQARYVADGTEAINATNAAGSVGLYSGTAPVSTTGLWTSNASAFILDVYAVSSGTRKIALYYGTGASSSAVSANVSTSQLTHYYELVGVSTATANTFTLSVYMDGALLMSDPTGRLQGSSTSDTTSLLIIAPNRSASFVAYDDMYLTLNDGTGLVGPMGQVSVVMETPNTDVQDQWVKTGSAASNSLSVGTGALSSNAGNYVSSTVAGDKDVYGTTSAIPAGYRTRAVQVEGYFSAVAGSTVANLGIKSGSTETDGTNQTVTSTTPLYTSQIYATDPNGGVAWTNASAHAANPVINHIS